MDMLEVLEGRGGRDEVNSRWTNNDEGEADGGGRDFLSCGIGGKVVLLQQQVGPQPQPLLSAPRRYRSQRFHSPSSRPIPR